MPKISVIVPVYNTEKYLRKCLESVVNQTYQDFEVIIVNDGSTDNSQEIINEYIGKYPDKVKCVNKQNGGLSSARNCGIEVAVGDYIAFVDSDDYIDVELFNQLKSEIDKNLDLIKFKLIVVEEGKQIEKISGPVFEEKNGEDSFNLLVFKDKLFEPSCLYLYKREFFIQNKFKFAENKYHEDFALTPLVLIKANSVSSKEIYGYFYMQTENSITRNDIYEKIHKSCYDLLFHYDNMVKIVDKTSFKKATKQNIKQYYSNSILLATKKLRGNDKSKYISEIKKRKLIKNIKIQNVKSLFKKVILFFSIRLYLKLK